MAEVNGTRLYYEVAGEGHPLVLIHAGIADSRMWDDQFDVFAQRYRVIRYDLRGFGRSEVPPGPYTLRDDLLGLLRYLGVERTYLVGVSIGGGLAIDFTLEHPDMVDALIPVAAGVGGLPPSEEDDEAPFEAIEAAIKAGDLARANELEIELWVVGPRRAADQVDARVRQRALEMNGDSFARQAENEQALPQRLDPPAFGRLGEIHAPTLVIVGDEDLPDVMRAANAVVAGVAGARKAVMHGAAHLPNMEQPAEFNRLVLDFLGGL
jgi:pimeloyl-ACP methyl ester carboxylesterase